MNIQFYVDYNLWANRLIGARLALVSTELIDMEIMSSFSSIRKTVFHIWDAETIWLARLQGTSPTEFPSINMPPDTPVHYFLKKSEEFQEFVHAQTEEFLKSEITYKTTTGTPYTMEVSGIIMHCMNHSTFHRGQIVTLLRQVGLADIPQTDLIEFMRKTEER